MGKKVIVLYGKGNCGKTTTIGMVYKKISNKFTDHEVKLKPCEEDVETKAIIVINGVKIGIESQGDPPYDRLLKSILEFVNAECDVIICVTRVWGRSVKLVCDEVVSMGYEDVWFRQQYGQTDSDKMELCDHMANQIFSKLEEIVRA